MYLLQEDRITPQEVQNTQDIEGTMFMLMNRKFQNMINTYSRQLQISYGSLDKMKGNLQFSVTMDISGRFFILSGCFDDGQEFVTPEAAEEYNRLMGEYQGGGIDASAIQNLVLNMQKPYIKKEIT